MAIAAPSPDAVARFRADLLALTGPVPGRLGVAVSGGPDSLALLLLAHAAFPDQVAAATVDHRLRAESAAEAKLVAAVCIELGVPHATLAADAAIAGNVQSEARALRYRLLGQWARGAEVRWLLTAHHCDDQAETLLMRLLRGAGASGLAGVRPTTRIAGLDVARPLLRWRRSELAEIVAAAELVPVEDPSNVDDRYDRARLRRRIAQSDWVDAPALAHSAGALADADVALDWMTGRLYSERVRGEAGAITLDPVDLPIELRRRLVGRILATLVPGATPRGPDLQRLLARLEDGGVATLAGVRGEGGSIWRFTPAPPRRR